LIWILEWRIETGSKIGSNFGTETKTQPETNSGTGTRIRIFDNNFVAEMSCLELRVNCQLIASFRTGSRKSSLISRTGI
jgi:hypothetical protein